MLILGERENIFTIIIAYRIGPCISHPKLDCSTTKRMPIPNSERYVFGKLSATCFQHSSESSFLAPTLFQLLLSTYQPWKIGIGVCGRPGTHRLIRHSRACWCLSFFFFRDAAARQPQPIECGKRFGEEVRSTVLYKKTLFCLCGVTRNPSPLERKSWRPAEYEHLIVVTVVTVGTAVTTYQVPFF